MDSRTTQTLKLIEPIISSYCDPALGEVTPDSVDIQEKSADPESNILTLGRVRRNVEIATVPGDITSGFLYFNLNSMPDLVEEGARLIAERISSLKLNNPHIVTPESSTIAMMHVLHVKYNIPSTILSKRRRPGDNEVINVHYCAVTSNHINTLFIEKDLNLLGKDIIIVDNVVTTGETIKAVYTLLMQIGAPEPIEAIVLFTEGETEEGCESTLVVDNKYLNMHRFGHIPLFKLNGMKAEPQYQHYSESNIPSDWGLKDDPKGTFISGKIKFHVFKHRCMEREAIAIVGERTFSDPNLQKIDGKWNNIPVRIHDACITSEVFHSLKCDCRFSKRI